MKKIKMKNLLCGALICVVPALMFAGCDEIYYTRTLTNKTATEFLTSILNDIKTFSGNINKAIETALSTEESPFDVQSIKQDKSTYDLLNSKVLNFAQKINIDGLFATCIYQMATENIKQEFFDMSFLSKNPNNQLKNFFVETESTINSKTIYKYKLTGEETKALNLPVTSASNPDLVDNIDAQIKTWGNNLQFVVTNGQGLASKNISINAVFSMPTDAEIELSLGNKEDCAYKIEGNKITVYYTDGSNPLTKVVEFNTTSEGVEKRVTKYNGDTRIDKTLRGQSYNYTLKIDDKSEINILGNYTISYDSMNSYISCDVKHSNTNKTKFEYFKTQSGELIGRIFNKETSGRSVANMIINTDLQTGLIKYDYQKGTTTYKALSEETNLSNAFCAITDEDKKLVSSNPTGAEILNYTINDKGIFVNRAKAVEEKKW